MNEKIEKVKMIIKEHFSDADCGIFNSRNIVGDFMTNIYDEDGVTIDICYGWAYFEVFGLTDEEFREIYNYYNKLQKGGVE